MSQENENLFLALLLKPLLIPIFSFLIIGPIVWVLYRLFPHGRLKAILFKVRDGPEASRRDRIVHWVASVGAILLMLVALTVYVGLHKN